MIEPRGGNDTTQRVAKRLGSSQRNWHGSLAHQRAAGTKGVCQAGRRDGRLASSRGIEPAWAQALDFPRVPWTGGLE
jgi:hypothetical protein